ILEASVRRCHVFGQFEYIVLWFDGLEAVHLGGRTGVIPETGQNGVDVVLPLGRLFGFRLGRRRRLGCRLGGTSIVIGDDLADRREDFRHRRFRRLRRCIGFQRQRRHGPLV
ncbi:MAG: hypothetical protein ACK559_11955, partial [bacterium]